jgi:hypothetical protein
MRIGVLAKRISKPSINGGFIAGRDVIVMSVSNGSSDTLTATRNPLPESVASKQATSLIAA